MKKEVGAGEIGERNELRGGQCSAAREEYLGAAGRTAGMHSWWWWGRGVKEEEEEEVGGIRMRRNEGGRGGGKEEKKKRSKQCYMGSTWHELPACQERERSLPELRERQ
jgi:hypothetical protein